MRHRKSNNAVHAQRIEWSPFKKSLLAMCIGAAVVNAPVFAQEAQNAQQEKSDDVEERIEVRGQRLSLTRAQEIKRNADTFVDAISSADLGALPDASVVEALQRVPGIAIERFAAPEDPDHFSTEGSDATLRGLPQTRTGINGRDSVAADSSNGLGFDDISPQLLGSVEIFKNQTADMIEGGIAGTINLNTRKPFDSSSRLMSFEIQRSEGNLSEEPEFGFSGLYSDIFDVKGGEIGFLVSHSDVDLTFRADGSELGQHNLVADAAGAGQDRYVPINAGVRTTTTDREREASSAAIQYQNTEETLVLTAEYIRSNSETNWQEFAFFSDDQAYGSIGEDASYDDVSFRGGTLLNIQSGIGPQTRQSQAEELLEEFTFNAQYQVTDALRVEFDIQHVEATTDIVDLSIFGGFIPSSGSGINILIDAEGDTPVVDFLQPSTSSQSLDEYFSDPSNYYYRAAMDHLEESEGDQTAFQFDVDYELEHDYLDSVEAGARYAERDQTTRWSTYNWQNLSEEWAGGWVDFNGDRRAPSWDGAPFSDIGDVAMAPPVQFGYNGFHNGNAGGAVNALFANPSLVASYGSFIDGLSGFARQPLSARAGVIEGTSYLPGEVNRVVEENTALYVKLNFGGESRWSGNVGLRYINVDTSVDGGENYPLQTSANLLLTPEQEAFFNGDSIVASTNSSYSTVLPSLNVKYLFGDNLVARFAFSKSIAFADSGNLRYNYNYSALVENTDPDDPQSPVVLDDIERRSGNPFLEPMESLDFDVSLEWYFDDSDSLSVGLFHKSIEGFFSNDTFVQDVTHNGVTLPVNVSTTINVGDGNLSGFELSYQQFFDELPGLLSNLGVQFNATLLKESGVPNQNTRPTQSGSTEDVSRSELPFDNLPLQGLSEQTYNFVGMYEDESIQARIAYNYRSDYLLTIRQVNLGVPIYNESRGQVDASFFYNLTEDFQIGIQGQNLTKSESNTRMQVDQEGNTVVRSSFTNDRRIAFILRGSF
ncbi:TonB-dependent receptor [Alteromonas sediminis]|uniref:TonB-dependent receptor n=1 Tax=Alteromonas sediminis TaxID=2259342 RepID=A0A3N5Y577_9ALTE|nr:TonB-dependent receptor [Alteromonas sediminis]RPJ68156.1 TonB-dependent receptor [Alteromonas sediminis]